MSRFIPRRIAVLIFTLAFVASCSEDTQTRSDNGKGTGGERRGSAGGAVDISGTGYHPGPLSAMGSVAGVVELTGELPSDTAPTASGQPACDVQPTEPGSTNGGTSATVVWIADPKTGKALPGDRRIEITTEHCQIEPRVRAMVAGSGVNVNNQDRLLHKLAFIRSGDEDTLAVMPFFNEGQVVASDRLAHQPGVVEIRCSEHGWMHGYLMVFDHPYFAMTSEDGSFRIDSLPPGDYKLMVWHEGAARPVQKNVKVSAGGVTKADVSLRLGGR